MGVCGYGNMEVSTGVEEVKNQEARVLLDYLHEH